MISRILPSMRMVGRVSGLASVAHPSFSASLSSFNSFDRVSSADQEIGNDGFAAVQKSFARESKNG